MHSVYLAQCNLNCCAVYSVDRNLSAAMTRAKLRQQKRFISGVDGACADAYAAAGADGASGPRTPPPPLRLLLQPVRARKAQPTREDMVQNVTIGHAVS
jgi:hypothetical protein